MPLHQINKQNKTFNFFDDGFRPFFLGGIIFSIVSIFMWMFVYSFHYPLKTSPMNNFQWHSHEMIYGYSMAIVVGFLLTAVRNWTGIQTLQGFKLSFLTLIWLVARICFLFGAKFLLIACIFDLTFLLFSIIAITTPIIKSKNWLQLGIISKLFLFFLGNTIFYLGCFDIIRNGIHMGIYSGLYLIISLILTIGSRVMPDFISNEVNYSIQIKVPKWISLTSILLFICFFINELFILENTASCILASLLFLINALKLYYWHTIGIWKKPLLWGLYLAFCFICLGFLVFSLTSFTNISKYLAIHLFAYGGIGFATLSMIARVSLGHSGKSIHNPPKSISLALTLLFIGLIFRIALPIIESNGYVFYIFISQTFWIISFLILLFSYWNVLLKHME